MTSTDHDADDEFGDEAAALAERIVLMRGDDRIAAACRGSAHPATLAWLTDRLGLDHDDRVVDLGAGLGGPAAWIHQHAGCLVVAADPSSAAAAGAFTLFGLSAVQATAACAPIGTGTCAATLLLGVLSVVDDRQAVYREARRVARAVGILDYCATSGDVCAVGGSHFPSASVLHEELGAHWDDVAIRRIDEPSPPSWEAAAQRAQAGVKRPASEREVIAAIEAGRLAPYALVGR